MLHRLRVRRLQLQRRGGGGAGRPAPARRRARRKVTGRPATTNRVELNKRLKGLFNISKPLYVSNEGHDTGIFLNNYTTEVKSGW